MSSPANILIQAIGNPLRSDDAVGPLLIDRLSEYFNSQSDCSIDSEWVYQLQIEQAEQWRRYNIVIIVDADSKAQTPVTWREIKSLSQTHGLRTDDKTSSLDDESLNSHRQSPEMIFRLMHEFFDAPSGREHTRVFVLGIKAEVFDIGETLSGASERALNEAEFYLTRKLKTAELN